MSRQSEWQAKRLAEGKCRQCGNRLDGRNVRCKKCRRKDKMSVDKRRQVA